MFYWPRGTADRSEEGTTVFELKPLSREGIPGALARVERYRLLNQPQEAESICLDILATQPGDQYALTHQPNQTDLRRRSIS